MADLFDACGVSYRDAEVVQCRDAYRDATDVQNSQCAEQTEDAIIENLRLKSESNDVCEVLQEYED